YDEAIATAEKGLAIAKIVEKPVSKLRMYQSIFNAYDSLDNPRQALAYYKKYLALSDSIRDEERLKQLAETRAMFDLDMKNREIETQQSMLNYQSNQIYFLFAVILLVSLLSVLFIRKKSISLKLKAANEELQQMRIEQMKKENRHLESDLEHKKRELISYSLNVVQKNNLISEIGEDLKGVNSTNDEKLRSALQKIKNKAGLGSRIDKNWDHFRKRFEEINPGFFTSLLKQYPKLTSHELKICALASLNLSSKEIATINEMTMHSLKIARYRIRKKLGMQTEQSFNEYFMLIGQGETI
ncbi:MAG: hypothetical protein WBA74_01420, partial [Cyclobacteriaceae bacterium]